MRCCKSQVPLSRAEKSCPAQEAAVMEESGCVSKTNVGSWSGPQGNLCLLELKTMPDIKADHEKAQEGPPSQRNFAGTLETWCDDFPAEVFCCSYNTLVLEAVQETPLGMRQALTNEKFLPATPATWRTTEQCRAWQDDGCGGLSRS